MSGTISYRFRLRRRLASMFASLNEILLDSEIGLASDTRELKVGDGATPWNSLPYLEAGMWAARLGDVDATGKADGRGLVWSDSAGKHVYRTASAGGASPIFVTKAYLNTAANSTNVGWQKVPLDAIEFDTGGWWNSTNKRIVPNLPGYYLFNVRARTNTSGIYTVALQKNGSGLEAVGFDSGGTAIAAGGTGVVYCNGTTDYLESRAYLTAVRAFTVGTFDNYLEVAGPLSSPTAFASADVPSSASAAGVAGALAYDGSHLYVCVAANTWKRVAVASW